MAEKALSVKRINAIAQKGMKEDIIPEFKKAAISIRGALTKYANENGELEPSDSNAVRRITDRFVTEIFVGSDGRSAFASDGVTPLAPFPRILNKWYARVVAMQIRAQQTWMQKNLPDDLYNWLKNARRPTRETDNPYLKRDDETLEEYKARAKQLRLFDPNPLAEYDPMHTWVDPNGYQLDDRIWRAGEDTRKALDRLIADAIKEGVGAEQLSRLVEQFLVPERALLRTQTPYGRDASYYAMRLARTEIARAANQAAYIAAKLNPYVGAVDIARSANGDPTCKICPQHATLGISGERLRPAYDLDNAKVPVFHPQCMCRTLPVVRDNPKEVTDSLQLLMNDTSGQFVPVVNPASGNTLIDELLGRVLSSLVPGVNDIL